MTPEIRVLVVDDDLYVRRQLPALLDAVDGLQVVGTCADGAAAVEAVRADPPDIVLIDLRMPVMDGLEATREIIRIAPGVRVIALTTFDDDDSVARILDSGGSGYLLKSTAATAMAKAIRAALDDLTVLPQDTMRRWGGARVKPPAPELRGREQQVLAHLAQGLTNREIARALFVSDSTIKAQVASLMRKLGAGTRAGLVARAHELRLLGGRPGPTPDEP